MRQSRLNGNTKRAVFVFIIYRKHTKLIIHVLGGGDWATDGARTFSYTICSKVASQVSTIFFSEVNTAFFFRVYKIVDSVTFRSLQKFRQPTALDLNCKYLTYGLKTHINHRQLDLKVLN